MATEPRVPEPLTVRAAIVHDWFQGFHGSERVVETMRTALFAPGFEPDVFTFHAARELLPPELARAIVKESRLAALPGLRQRGFRPGYWRSLLPYMPRYFRSLDLGSYDLVISSSHACAVHVRPRDDAVHACYCYTPMRYAWLPETERQRVRGVRGVALRLLRSRLQRLDLEASRRPHGYAAISTAVRERIRRFYGRDAEVIHPPVDVDEFEAGRTRDDASFLWVHRLVPYKRPELVVEAFRTLPYRLTMVGVGPLEQRLRASLPPNVELLGWLSRKELVRLYEHAMGFIHVGEEDFGITMVEALAAGSPVIGLDAGGSRDIVRDGEDGMLLRETDVESLRRAVREVAAEEWDRTGLAARARTFSREHFVARLRSFLAELRKQV